MGYRSKLQSYSLDPETGAIVHNADNLKSAGWMGLVEHGNYRDVFAAPVQASVDRNARLLLNQRLMLQAASTLPSAPTPGTPQTPASSTATSSDTEVLQHTTPGTKRLHPLASDDATRKKLKMTPLLTNGSSRQASTVLLSSSSSRISVAAGDELSLNAGASVATSNSNHQQQQPDESYVEEIVDTALPPAATKQPSFAGLIVNNLLKSPPQKLTALPSTFNRNKKTARQLQQQ